MKLKRCVNYQMDLGMPWLDISALMAGISFLLIVLRYYILDYSEEIQFGEKLFNLILPLLLLGVYMVTLRAFRLKSPAFFAAIASIYCLLAIIWSFDTGSVLRIVFAFVWYVITIGVLQVTVAGLLPLRWFSVAAFVVPVLYRFFIVDWKSYFEPLDLKGMIPDVTVLFGLLGFLFLSIGFKETPLRTPPRVQKQEVKE